MGWRLCCLWHLFWSSNHHEPGPLCSWPAEFCPDQASLADAQQLLLTQSCLPQERKYVTNSKREVTPFQLTHYQSSLCHQHCKSLRHLQAAGSCAEQEQPVNRAMGLGGYTGRLWTLQLRYLRHRKLLRNHGAGLCLCCSYWIPLESAEHEPVGSLGSAPLPEPALCLGNAVPTYRSIHHKEKHQKGTYCSIGNFYICETNMLLLSSSTDNWDIYSKENKEHNTLKHHLEIGPFILSSVSG